MIAGRERFSEAVSNYKLKSKYFPYINFLDIPFLR